MRHTSWALLARVFLALHLVMASAVPSNLLLCFGPGGHFELETAHPGTRCHGDAAATDVVPLDGCTDVALTVAPASLATALDLLSVPPVTAVLLPPASAPRSLVATAALSRSPATRPDSATLRTVILLS